MSFYEGELRQNEGKFRQKRVHCTQWVRQKTPQKAYPGATGDCGGHVAGRDRACAFECGALSFERDRRGAVEPRADVVEALPLALERSPRGSLQ